MLLIYLGFVLGILVTFPKILFKAHKESKEEFYSFSTVLIVISLLIIALSLIMICIRLF